jgi:excinuclease UvrABC nuclease subunit
VKITEPKLRHVLEPLCLEFLDLLPEPTVVPRSWDMPQIPTVYALLDDSDTVLYVGQTKNLRLRLAQHANSSRKAKLNYSKVAFFTPHLPSRHQRLVLESILTILTIPADNRIVALRRTKYNCWVEIQSFRYATSKAADAGEERNG